MQKSLLTASLLITALYSQNISIQKGWQLLGTAENLSTNVFDSSGCVDYIWKYDAANTSSPWGLHIANGVNYNNTYNTFSQIEKNSGYWVKGNSSCEFNTTLETKKFSTIFLNDFNDNNVSLFQAADWSNGNPFYNAWCPEQIDFNNSLLTLTLEKKACHSKTHASGEYRTIDTYKYGRYSTRFIASDVNGTISSFFTYTGSSEGTEWDEIDIEILGKNPNKMQINYWRNGNEHPILIDLGFDTSLTMHTYSFVWSSEYIQWYVDDILVYTVNENHLNNKDSLPINAGKIILNLWAGVGIDNWSGKYDDNTTTKISYDYVKYEKFIE